MDSFVEWFKQQVNQLRIGNKCIGLSAAFLTVTIYSFGLPSVQILDGAVPEFELNAVRFFVQIIISSPFILYYKPSLWIPKEHIKEFFLFIIVQNIVNISYYTAPVYLPVGTLEGTKVAVTICCNVLAAFLMKVGDKSGFVAAATSIIGALLMVQPGFIFHNANLYRHPPTNWTSECVTLSMPNISHRHLVDDSAVVWEDSHSNEWIGYLLVLVAGLTVSATLILLQKMQVGVKFYVIGFLTGFANWLISLILMFAIETPVLPTILLCITMLLLHSFAVSQILISTAFCLHYISTVNFAVIISLGLVFQFLYQNTILKHIDPGLGNWVEAFGAVLCFCGSIAGPLQLILQPWMCSKANYDNIEGNGGHIELLK